MQYIKLEIMVVGLLTVLLILFSGGYESFLLNPDMKKNVHTYVEDKENVKEINEILKQTKKEQKYFHNHILKKAVNEIETANLNIDATQKDYDLIVNPFFKEVEALQQSYIGSEMKTRALISESEWKLIMDKVLAKHDKDKTAKQFAKYSAQLEENLINACESSISDENNIKKARELVVAYRENVDNLTEAIMNLGYKHQETIRDYDANQQAYESIQASILDLRKKLTGSLVKMTIELKGITPDVEWKNLAKKINKHLSNAEKQA